MPTKLIAFAFQGTNSAKVLNGLDIEHKVLIPSDPDEIPDYVNKMLSSQPHYILGLGQYSGKDTDMLKIETYCSNKFRNTVRGPRYEEIGLDNFLMPGKHSRYAKSMGNSYCNLISYLIMTNIREKNLQTQYSFIHIPKSFDLELATSGVGKSVRAS